MFDSNQPGDRQALVEALQSIGLEARQADVGEGKQNVIVPLLDMGLNAPIVDSENPELETYHAEAAQDWSNRAYLYVTTQRTGEGTQIGVTGKHADTGEKFSSEIWKKVASLDEAVAAFQEFWQQRDTWINNFSTQAGKAEA